MAPVKPHTAPLFAFSSGSQVASPPLLPPSPVMPQVQAALAASGVSNRVLSLGPNPAAAEAAIAAIPTGTRVLLFYTSPDR